MKSARSILSAPSAAFVPKSGRCPDRMLEDLLALHEEMVVQLVLERISVVGTADFLLGLIDQHEKAAAMIRALLENAAAHAAGDGMVVIPSEASSDAEKFLIAGFAPGLRGESRVAPG
jgi:hypothetical protein